MILSLELLKERIIGVIINKKEQGFITKGLEEKLNSLPESYDELIKFGISLSDIQINPKWKYIEPNNLDEIREESNPNRQTGKISQGDVIQTTVPTPKNTIPVTEATTKVKYDKNFLKRKIKNFDKNKFYTPKDIANILGLNVSTKNDLDYLTATFKRFGVKAKDKTGQQKLYQLGDAVNKTTKGFKNKLVKGDRKSQTNRINIISKTDKPLDRFISNIYSRIRSISKDFDIFEPGAVEDVGHPMSVKITDKFPKLFKNSNINKISSLVFQDPEINQKVLEATGYEAKHEKLFARLKKFCITSFSYIFFNS